MKILVTYSSRTGNTKKVAEGIFDSMPKENSTLLPMENVTAPEEYDVIFIGYWVDKGMPNAETQAFMEKVKGKNTGVFVTLGDYPHTNHAKESLQNGVRILENQRNKVLCEFICQGKIDEKLIEAFKKFPEGHFHALTEEKLKKYAIAALHPNDEDIREAQEIFKKGLERLCS